MSAEARRAAYNADITYATNNELGFDYLRDNMRFELKDMVQRPFHYAIIDEVDSILIDEARTPLIISGAAEDSSEKYILVNRIIPKLSDDDYEKDEKARQVTLTEKGMVRVEELLKEVLAVFQPQMECSMDLIFGLIFLRILIQYGLL